MAFPTIQSSATSVSSTTNSLTFTPTLPSGSGGLLVAIVAIDGNTTITPSAGWAVAGTDVNSTIVNGRVFWKESTGSDALTVTSSGTEQYSAIIYRIDGANRVTATSKNGSSTNSNPPLHTAIESGDILWIAARCGDSNVVPTVAPTGYSGLLNRAAGGTAGASTSAATKTATAASDDPATFTVATEQWVAFTIAVQQYVPVLVDLTMDFQTPGSTSPTGTAVGNVLGKQMNSTLSLVDNAGGLFTLVSDQVRVNGTLGSGPYSITVRETNAISSPTTHDTVFTITPLSSLGVIAYQGSGTTAAVTSFAATMPIGAGGYLLAIVSGTSSLLFAATGWEILDRFNGSRVSTAVMWKKAAGGDTFTLSAGGGSFQATVNLYRLSGASLGFSGSCSGFGNNTGTSCDPPTISFPNTIDGLVFANRHGFPGQAIYPTAIPTGYSNERTQPIVGSSGATSTSQKVITGATSEDPSPYITGTATFYETSTVVVFDGSYISNGPTFRTSKGGQTGTTSTSVTLPSDSVGDNALLIVTSDNTDGSNPPILPAGWTEINYTVAPAGFSSRIYKKDTQITSASPFNITFATASAVIWAVITFDSLVDMADLIIGTSSTGTGGNPTASSITTTDGYTTLAVLCGYSISPPNRAPVSWWNGTAFWASSGLTFDHFINWRQHQDGASSISWGSGVATYWIGIQIGVPNVGTGIGDVVSYEAGSGTQDRWVYQQGLPAMSGTFSVWAKLISGDGSFTINDYDNDTNSDNPVSITITPTWQRFVHPSVTITSNTADNIAIGKLPTQMGAAVIALWGAQFEAGGSATDLEQTTTAVGSKNKIKQSSAFDNAAAWTKGGGIAPTVFANNAIDPIVAASGPIGVLSISLAGMTVVSDGQVTGTGGALGSLSQSFEALTLSGAGVLPVAANSAVTLSALSRSITGVAPLAGSASITFSALSRSITGVSPIGAATSITFDPLTLTSVGVLPIGAATSITFDPLTLTSVGVLPIGGTGGGSGSTSLSSGGSASVTGSLTSLLGPMACAATIQSEAANGGAASLTFDPLTLTSQGALLIQGSLSASLVALSLASAAAAPVQGSASGSLGSTLAATATVSVTGALQAVLGALQLASASSVSVTGSGGGSGSTSLTSTALAAVAANLTRTLGALTALSTATTPIAGSGGGTGSTSLSSNGAAAVLGNLVQTLGNLSLAASLGIVNSGSASGLGSTSLSSTASAAVAAALNQALGQLVLLSAGVTPVAGSGGGSGSTSLSSSGMAAVTANLSKALGILTSTATGGAPAVIGSLSAALGALNLLASGATPAVGNLNYTQAPMSGSATATLPAVGNLSRSLAATSLVSTVGAVIGGTLSKLLGALQLVATASAPVTGSGGGSGSTSLSATAGSVIQGVLSAVGSTLLSATGVIPATGNAAITLAPMTLVSRIRKGIRKILFYFA